ncbi:MAG TPA: histidine kinase [Terracidiphilus sp.]|nr:histidine kinase [Terracidiphilus sp.]
MTLEDRCCEIEPSTGEIRGPSIATQVLRLAWIVPGVALLCLALFLSIGRTKLSQSGRELVVIFVYSTLIGPLSAILLTWISKRFSEKYPRMVVLVDAGALLLTATVGVLAGSVLLQWMKIAPRGAFRAEFWDSWPFAVLITLMVGMSITTYETLRYKLHAAVLEARTRQMEQERAYKLLAEARLSALESRIHPHFLFNTLNSIASLIPSDPQRAEDTVGKLASLLRFSLNAQQRSLVPLAQELRVVRDYLEIESTRFGERLRYEIHTPSAMDSIQVPPLAVQCVAENSVKHVVAQRPSGASIRISGAMNNGRARLEVIDDGPGFSLGSITPEHGLGNLVARLDLLFGGQGKLDVVREDEKTIVRLSFPAEL